MIACLRLLTVLLLVLPLAAQEQVRGRVLGRVLGPDERPVADCHAEVIVRRGLRDVVVARARTGRDGSFVLKTGAFPETPWLRLRASNLAPREFRLRSLTSGDGLLLPDLRLREGRRVEIPILRAADATSSAPFEVRVFPLHGEQRVVDIDGPPLVWARPGAVDRVGFQLDDGLHAFVVVDLNGNHAPSLLVWKVGPGTRSLPGVWPLAGRDLRLSVSSPVAGALVGDVVVGAGVWHPRGGAEYRLRIGVGKKIDAGQTRLVVRHLPLAHTQVRLSCEERGAVLETTPGGPELTVELLPCGLLRGSVGLFGSNEELAGARVQIGELVTFSAADGSYRIEGILPGRHRLHLSRPGHPSRELGEVAYPVGDYEQRLELELEGGARIVGDARDLNLKPLVGALIGFRPVVSEEPAFGLRVQTLSDERGDFELTGLPAGPVEIGAVGPGGVFHADRIELEANSLAAARPRLLVGAKVGGRIQRPDGAPLAGARVYFVASPAPAAIMFASDPDERLSFPLLRRAVCDEKGRYRIDHLPEGRYERLVVATPGLRLRLPPVDLFAGESSMGLDWKFLDEIIPEPPPVSAGLLGMVRYSGHPGLEHWVWREEGQVLPWIEHRAAGQPWLELFGAFPALDLEDGLYREHPRVRRILSAVELGSAKQPAFLPRERADSLRTTLELHLRVQGDAPSGAPMEITAYQLSGVCPGPPLRIAAPLEESFLELELPRGLWLFQGRVPGLGGGFAGPISLGRGHEEGGAPELVLDVVPDASVIGRIVLDEPLPVKAPRVFVKRPREELVAPFVLPSIDSAIEPDGSFSFARVPSGPATLAVESDDWQIRVPIDIEPFEVSDLGDLVPESRTRTTIELDTLARFGARIADRAGERDLEDRLGAGAQELRVDLDLALGAEATRLRRLVANDLPERRLDQDALTGSGRSRLALRIWGPIKHDVSALRLDAVAADGFDHARSSFDLCWNEDDLVTIGPIAAGDYAVGFDHVDRDGHRYRTALPIRLSDTSATQTRRFDLRTRDLKVNASDARDGLALSGATVLVKRNDLRGIEHESAYRRRVAVAARGRCNEDGEIRFSALPLGVYDVEVHQPGVARARLQGVDLRAPGPLRVVDLSADRGRRLEIRIVDDAERPLAGMRVFLFDGAGMPVHAELLLLTDGDGRLEVGDLPPGTVVVRARGAGFPAQRLGAAKLEPSRRVFEQFEARAAASLEVVCRDEDGNPLPGARVSLDRPDSARLHGPDALDFEEIPTLVTRNGSRRLAVVPSGPCRILAEKEGYARRTRELSLRAGERRRVVIRLPRIP